MKPAHHFHHEAMRTTFHIRFAGTHPDAGHIARQCFDHIDFLEARLSRYKQDSDIARINHLPAGETHYISPETHRCLMLAIGLYEDTAGLFDITIGQQIQHRKDSIQGPPPDPIGKITIHPDAPAVTCIEAGRVIDLGGIGKGFALDSITDILTEWEAPPALISAGSSTHLSWGNSAWPIHLEFQQAFRTIHLKNAAISASGTDIQGSHIVHPDAADFSADGQVWVVADDAATADAWSTALILCPHVETRAFVDGAPRIRQVIRPESM